MLTKKTRKFWLFFLLSAYLILLFRLIIIKDLPPDLDTIEYFDTEERNGFEKANFTPFKTIAYYGTLQEDLPTGIQNLGGNIILFIPIGLLFTAFLVNKNFWRILGYTLLISAVFELVQLFSGYGTCDVDDLLLNAIGGAIGFVMYFITEKLVTLFRQ
jgi:glycopeptide antibiotics resistance protein